MKFAVMPDGDLINPYYVRAIKYTDRVMLEFGGNAQTAEFEIFEDIREQIYQLFMEARTPDQPTYFIKDNEGDYINLYWVRGIYYVKNRTVVYFGSESSSCCIFEGDRRQEFLEMTNGKETKPIIRPIKL